MNIKPWDIVKLKNHTGRYRVYTGPLENAFYFACMDADVLRTSLTAEVEKVLESVEINPTGDY